MVYEFDGTKHEKLRDMQAARRAKYLDLVRGGMNFTQAARAVGVSKRTGKVWRNGRTRSTGRNERPLMDWYRGGMDKPKTTSVRYLSLGRAHHHRRHAPRRKQRPRHRQGPRQGAQHISRELRRNADDIGGGYGPNRARQMASHRLRRPKDRKIAPGTRLWDEVRAGPTGTGAPNGSAAGSGSNIPATIACTRAARPSARPSTCKARESCDSSSNMP